MTLPFGYVLNPGFYIIPAVTFIFYVLVSLELIAGEIDDPFSMDENDLPVSGIAENIRLQIAAII